MGTLPANWDGRWPYKLLALGKFIRSVHQFVCPRFFYCPLVLPLISCNISGGHLACTLIFESMLQRAASPAPKNCSHPPSNAYVAHIFTSAYICQVYADRRKSWRIADQPFNVFLDNGGLGQRDGRQMREKNPQESDCSTAYSACTFSSFIAFKVLIIWTDTMSLVFQ